MTTVSNHHPPLFLLAPSVPGPVRVKSLVRVNTMYHTMKGRLQRQKSSDTFSLNSAHWRSAQSLISVGLGSGPFGELLTHLKCANQSVRARSARGCTEQGFIVCPRCQLVKKQHWPRHSSICSHPYLEENWQPGWILQDRPPSFACASTSFHPSSFISPAFDVLQLAQNEGVEVLHYDFKLCFAGKEPRSFPVDYQGRFDVLLNSSDPIIINRNLVTLYALLNPELSMDEVAELAVHLMYSSSLSAPGAAYLQRCLDDIYASRSDGGDIAFRASLDTRGKGRIYSLQTAAGIKQPLEMFTSTYKIAHALRNRLRILDAPESVDSWDRFLSKLRPSHRMAFQRFRETGVLVPFSTDTSNFTHPNRLMFSSQGEWLGRSDFNPFQGWDPTAVQESGAKIAMIESADIFGCLFFHLKAKLRKFISQVKDLDINFVLTQYDPQILAKGISAGAIPIFRGACFDRVDTKDLMDEIGIGGCLADWGPLLKRENPFASLLMQSRAWHYERPHALARCNPHVVLEILMHKCLQIPGLKTKLKDIFAQGLRSPALLRIIESLDAFYDHDIVFREFLADEKTDGASTSFGLERRIRHRIHAKRFGVPLDAQDHQLPDISKSEFYDLASLCEVDFSARFLEFGWRVEGKE
ncbi:hypothetical protein GYMLUDRAFT_265499 [Collybiopsis luxurians FD-317 M1]|uniref:DUF4470 domain-containing protein n=1 Tax=Collybiopsis luxurians FD-317 M1 TaxID=944289 RepID=A0A0D0BRN9_9AGAR|nr:hypothetical protein GYMLUDRAFT_265499 [Collybiopsis luxurians FD-317 M1]